jgi:hypothetical protein
MVKLYLRSYIRPNSVNSVQLLLRNIPLLFHESEMDSILQQLPHLCFKFTSSYLALNRDSVVQQPVGEQTLIQVDSKTEFTLNNTEFT